MHIAPLNHNESIHALNKILALQQLHHSNIDIHKCMNCPSWSKLATSLGMPKCLPYLPAREAASELANVLAPPAAQGRVLTGRAQRCPSKRVSRGRDEGRDGILFGGVGGLPNSNLENPSESSGQLLDLLRAGDPTHLNAPNVKGSIQLLLI